MHADACYPHRRGSRSPSEVHEHTEDTKGTLRSMSAGDAYDRLDELD